MTISKKGASVPEIKTFRLFRDNAVPLQFKGEEIAAVERNRDNDGELITIISRAAIYRTQGGSFVSEFTMVDVKDSDGIDVPFKAKVESFATLEAAAGWFRPGQLTRQLLKEIENLVEPELID
jgi:hypothetical protein